MSESKLAADQKLHDAEDAARDEAEEKAPESGRRPIVASEAGAKHADAVREQLEKLFGVSIPSPEEVMSKVEALERGSRQNKDISGIVHVISQKPIQYVRKMHKAEDGSPGWHCQAIKKDTERISVAQSQALAEVINDRIDPDIMRQKAAANRKRNERKTAERADQNEEEPVDETAAALDELISETIREVEDVSNMNELTDIVLFCRRHNLLEVDIKGKHWEVQGLEGNKESHKLAQVINSKKKRLLRIIGAEKKTIAEHIQEIEHCPDIFILGQIAWKLADPRNRKYGYVTKRFPGNREIDWEVTPIKGRQGGREIAEALTKRYAELMAEHEAHERQQAVEAARNDLETLKKRRRGRK